MPKKGNKKVETKQTVKQSVIVKIGDKVKGKRGRPRKAKNVPVVISRPVVYTEPSPAPRLNVPTVDSIAGRIPLANTGRDALPEARKQKADEYLETNNETKVPAFIKLKPKENPYAVEVQAQKDAEEVKPNARGKGLSPIDVFNRPQEVIGVVPTANDPYIKFQKNTQDYIDVAELAGNTDKTVPDDEQAEGTLTKTAFQEKGAVGGFQVPMGEPKVRKERIDKGKPRGSYKAKQFQEGLLTGYSGARELSTTDTEMAKAGFTNKKASGNSNSFDVKFGKEMAFDSTNNNNPVLKAIDPYLDDDTPADGYMTVDSLLFEG